MKDITRKLSRRIVFISTALILIIGGFFAFYIYPTFIFSPSLGNKLEYIGKTDYGCWLVCDSNPASTYYYATDMSLDEVSHSLFQKASLSEKPQLGSTTLRDTDVYYQWVQYKNTKESNFGIDYYQDASELRKFYGFKDTSKPYIISIDSQSYETAKDSL